MLRAALFSILLATLFPSLSAAAQHDDHGGSRAPDGAEERPADLTPQLDAVRKATARFRDLDVAKAEGYRRFGRGEQPLVGEHWYRKDLVRAPLDLERPSTLIYSEIAGGPRLIGVAYTTYRRPHDPLPEGFAGDEDVWHTHDVARLLEAVTEDRPFLRWVARRRLARAEETAGSRTQLTMVHAWVWLENPQGPFALRHYALPYVKADLPMSWAATATEATALGVSLLEDGACARETDALHVLVRLSGDQREALRSSCDGAAAKVGDARTAGLGPQAFNAVADAAWESHARVLHASLTADQRGRIEGLQDHVTHGPAHTEHAR